MTERSLTGLRDAHLHLAEHGEELSCINLADCTSRDECLERVAAEARSRDMDETGPGPRPWIKAVAARNEAWRDTRWPTAQELHDAANGIPAIIMSFDHHAVVASNAALQAVGINDATPDPRGGVIEKRDGRCTGLLLEEACWIIRRGMPAPSEEQTRAHVRAALADLSSRGFVEVHDMLSRPLLAKILLELESEGTLDMHVRLYATRESFDHMARQSEQWESERIRLGGLKIFTDGTLNSRTASMLHDFVDPIPGHARGKPMMSTDEIAIAIAHADEAGYPVAAHAIGDAAVRSFLDAIKRVGPSTMGQRLEHAQFVDVADIERFASLGVIASVQPCHLLTDIEAIERYTPHRKARAFPLLDLIASAEAAGFDGPDLVWLGSDAPIVPPEPLDNLQASVERRRIGMSASAAIGAEQSITHDVAMSCMRSALAE